MSAQENEALVRRFLEEAYNDDAWHKEDLEAAYQVYSDSVVFERVPFR